MQNNNSGRYMDYTSARGYLRAVIHFFPLMTKMGTNTAGENEGVLKQLAVALFVPIVTGIFTALVTGYVAQAVLTERLTQMQQQTEKNFDRLTGVVDRLSQRVDRNDDKTQAWIIQHERDKGK